MFKKKKDQGQAAPEKPQKASSKKSKGGSSGGMKNFFLLHTEKVVLGLIAAVAAFLIWDGTSVKTLKEKTPEQLTQISTQAERSIQEPHWPAIEAERKVTVSYSSQLEKSTRTNDPNAYPLPVWDFKNDSGGIKRADPKLLPPVEIEIQPFWASLLTTTNNKRYEDPLKNFKNAPGKANPNAANMMGAGGMAMGTEGEGSMMSPGGAGGKNGGGSGSGFSGGIGGSTTEIFRQFNPKYDRGVGGGAGMGMGMGMGMEGSAMGMGMEGYAGMGQESSSPGSPGGGGKGMSAPGGGATMGTTGMTGMSNEPMITMATAVMFNAVKALVPYQDQIHEYNSVLENSSSHDPRRDFPMYSGFEVERSIVVPGKDPKWELMDNTKLRITHEGRPKSWMGSAPEIVNALYTHPKLTMAIPPVLIQDYRKFAKHSKTPTMFDMISLPGMKRSNNPEEEGDFVKTADPGAGMAAGGMGMGMGMGMEGYAGMGAMGMEGSSMGMGMEGYAGMGTMGMEGSAMGYGAEGSAMGYGMDGGMGMMGMGTSMPKTKYKLIRFYDFDVKPGVVYQYRVRVLMEDPNYPKYFMAPPMQSLEPEALKRVQDLDVADKRVNDKILAEDYDKNGRPKDRKDPKTGNRILPRKLAKSSTRKSDWSAPSRMVRFPQPSSVAVGKFSTESGNKMRLATAAWHVVPAAVGGSGVGVEVYRNDSVSRGDIVYGKTTVGTGSTKAGPSLINPITKRVVSMPLDVDFHFRPNLVLDVKAPRGLSVSQTGRDPIETSAEVVAVDPETGDVRITHEFNDFDNFRMYSFADEEEAASKKQPSGPAMGTGTPGGAGGGSAKRGGGGREG